MRSITKVLLHVILNSHSARQKETKLVLKICGNIISNPSEISKYGSLNWNKLNAKLTNCKVWLNLLFFAGFEFKTIHNTERLIWNNTPENMEQIEDIYLILNMNQDELTSLSCLIKEQYTITEAINAIKLSTNE